MPPGGVGGGCRHGCTAQDHPPATLGRHEEDPLLVLARLASQEKKRKQHEYEQEQPAASLPEGPLAEILARVPYRSLCRFKCVSKPWLALCSSRDICKRSPQTLSGFCGGLLLCACWKLHSMDGESHYVVCNPATEEWTVLPPIVFPAKEEKDDSIVQFG